MGVATACYPDAHPESPSIDDDRCWTCHKFNADSDFAPALGGDPIRFVSFRGFGKQDLSLGSCGYGASGSGGRTVFSNA